MRGKQSWKNGLIAQGQFSQFGPFVSFVADNTSESGIIDLSDLHRPRLIMPEPWMKKSELIDLDRNQKRLAISRSHFI